MRAAIIGFMLVGLLTYQTVSSGETVEKSVTSSLRMKTALKTLRDISNAFKVVTNDSIQIEQLIPKMFNLSLENPAYVFRLPTGGGFVTMQKSDFVQPTFPNLTASYVRLMNSKGMIKKNYNGDDSKYLKPTKGDNDLKNRINHPPVEEDDPTLFLNLQTERNFVEYLNKMNQQDELFPDNKQNGDDDWSLLGLNGWKGKLSKPKKPNNRPLFIDEDKQQSEPSLKWDLPGRMQEGPLQGNLLEAMKNTSLLKIIGNFSQKTYPITNAYDAHSDKDVYIGRVNDPFGHSTKWNFKNSSLDVELENRKKRAVVELYSMVKCSTGCDPIVYKGYGCYCGFLGDGQSVDGIDQCCRLHDKCYENSNCISYLEYFVPYIWKCYRGKPLCAIDHGEWGGPDSCAARLCKCDLTLSRCLRRFICPQRRAICRTSRARLLQNVLLNF